MPRVAPRALPRSVIARERLRWERDGKGGGVTGYLGNTPVELTGKWGCLWRFEWNIWMISEMIYLIVYVMDMKIVKGPGLTGSR